MARLVQIVVAISIATTGGWAQTPDSTPSPWDVTVDSQPVRSFDLSTGPSAAPTRTKHGSDVVAGTQLLPNGSFGVGLFGEKKAKEITHGRATARDLSVPRTRKPAVGFSLRF